MDKKKVIGTETKPFINIRIGKFYLEIGKLIKEITTVEELKKSIMSLSQKRD